MIVLGILGALLAGVAAGMGMGGGTILIPALTLLMGVAQHDAQLVNMIAFIPAAIVAIVIHKKEGRIDVKGLVPMIIAGVAGAVLGALAASALEGGLLRKVFGGGLVLLSLRQLVKSFKRQSKGA
ncbi:MAG: TSUP family transporter [Clostridia bacterium]|nr:TSUP family transporter [Clostridia bacterium]